MSGVAFALLRRAGVAGVAAAVGMTGLVVSVSTAHAYSKRVERACKADYQNLCPQYRPNSAQLRACMESKSSSISWGCIEALVDAGEVDKKRVARGR